MISRDIVSTRETTACSSVGAFEDVEDDGEPGIGEITLRDKETSVLMPLATFCRAVRKSSTARRIRLRRF